MTSKFLISRITFFVFVTVLLIGFQPTSTTMAQSDVVPTLGQWVSTFDFVVPGEAQGFSDEPLPISTEITFNITQDGHGIIGSINIGNPIYYFGVWNSTWTATIQSGLFSAQFALPYISGTSVYATWSGVFVSPSEVHGILSFGDSTRVYARDVQWIATPVASQ
ncbi:MAG: hypothetical protein IPO91_34000 [Chloroflexi bacterium]|nr:hypothetical protein [Chloroflexota bacterium]